MNTAIQPRATCGEVALRAGVSRTTVSFVLNGLRNKGISESTRQKVLDAARDLGYQPNAAARIVECTSASGASIEYASETRFSSATLDFRNGISAGAPSIMLGAFP